MNLSGMFGFLTRLMPWRTKTRAGVKSRPVKAMAAKTAAAATGTGTKPAAPDPRAAAKRARAAARINRKGR